MTTSTKWRVWCVADGTGPTASLSNHCVVVVTQSSWHEPPRIRHQVTRQMARFTHVFYVEIPSQWRRITRTTTEEIAPNITRVVLGNPHRIPRRVHQWIDPLRAMLNRHYLSEITELESFGDKPVLINFVCEFTEAMRSEAFAITSYLCNDSFVTFATDWWARRAIASRERETAAAADLCLTVSTVLAERLRQSNPNTTVLLPGHELTLRPPMPRRPGPIRVGFMGYLDHRLHYDWLIDAVRAGMNVHLVGPVAAHSDALTQLMAMPGVTAHGARVGEEMQAILMDMDVLVVPYSVEGTGMLPMTAPNKLYTYLAVAKPIVVSALPHLVKMEDGLIYEAKTSEGFVAAIRRAVEEDDDRLRGRRQSIAGENTWNSRGDELRTMLEDGLARRSVR